MRNELEIDRTLTQTGERTEWWLLVRCEMYQRLVCDDCICVCVFLLHLLSDISTVHVRKRKALIETDQSVHSVHFGVPEMQRRDYTQVPSDGASGTTWSRFLVLSLSHVCVPRFDSIWVSIVRFSICLNYNSYTLSDRFRFPSSTSIKTRWAKHTHTLWPRPNSNKGAKGTNGIFHSIKATLHINKEREMERMREGERQQQTQQTQMEREGHKVTPQSAITGDKCIASAHTHRRTGAEMHRDRFIVCSLLALLFPCQTVFNWAQRWTGDQSGDSGDMAAMFLGSLWCSGRIESCACVVWFN